MSLLQYRKRWAANPAPVVPPAIPGRAIDLGFVLGKIRAQGPAVRRRWAESSKRNFIRRQAKRLVIAQWEQELLGA